MMIDERKDCAEAGANELARMPKPATAIPPYDQMMWPVLQALVAMGGSANVREIYQRVVDIAQYSEEQTQAIHGKGPQTEIEYRMAWARTYLGKVQALSNGSRGIWSITDHGRTLREADMTTVVNTVRGMRSTRNGKEPTGIETNSAVDEAATEVNAIVDIPEQFRSTLFAEWRDHLLETLLAMAPSQFERLCQRVLRESGFTKVEVTGRTGDGGIDGTGVMRISLLSFQVLFQCKRYQGNVGANDIRNFRGAMVGRTDKGLFITTGSFTSGAISEASRDGAPAIDLIDGEQLCILLKNLSLGVETRQVEEVSILSPWFSSL